MGVATAKKVVILWWMWVAMLPASPWRGLEVLEVVCADGGTVDLERIVVMMVVRDLLESVVAVLVIDCIMVLFLLLLD